MAVSTTARMLSGLLAGPSASYTGSTAMWQEKAETSMATQVSHSADRFTAFCAEVRHDRFIELLGRITRSVHRLQQPPDHPRRLARLRWRDHVHLSTQLLHL